MKNGIRFIQIIFLLFISTSLVAQKTINNYKYVIVSNQFPFQKDANQYQINELTKFLFSRAGFTVLNGNDDFPEEVLSNRCSALNGIVISDSKLFTTNVKIKLTDCYNNVVFTSEEGQSRLKEFTKAYNEAIRDAFKSIEALNYKYSNTQPVENNKLKEVIEPTRTQNLPKVITKTDAVKPILKSVETIQETQKEQNLKSLAEIEGVYQIDKWGKVNILKKDDFFSIIAGDEQLKIGQIFSTSNPTTFIVKWAAFKRPQLIVLDENGNLKIDSDSGIELAIKSVKN